MSSKFFAAGQRHIKSVTLGLLHGECVCPGRLLRVSCYPFSETQSDKRKMHHHRNIETASNGRLMRWETAPVIDDRRRTGVRPRSEGVTIKDADTLTLRRNVVDYLRELRDALSSLEFANPVASGGFARDSLPPGPSRHPWRSRRYIPTGAGARDRRAQRHGEGWWARTVSNRRPLVCKTRALPLSYAPYMPAAGYTSDGQVPKTSGPLARPSTPPGRRSRAAGRGTRRAVSSRRSE